MSSRQHNCLHFEILSRATGFKWQGLHANRQCYFQWWRSLQAKNHAHNTIYFIFHHRGIEYSSPRLFSEIFIIMGMDELEIWQYCQTISVIRPSKFHIVAKYIVYVFSIPGEICSSQKWWVNLLSAEYWWENMKMYCEMEYVPQNL